MEIEALTPELDALRPELDEMLESRYVGLVHLARTLAEASDWKQLVAVVSHGLEQAIQESSQKPPAVRLWAITSGGFDELARFPGGREFAHLPPHELQRVAELDEPVETLDSELLVGLHSGGVSLGVLEVDQAADRELVGNAAPIIAARVNLLAGQGVDGVLLTPVSVEAASDAASLMSAFASEAKRLLEHDRLSVYLLTCEGRAFERFAVATSSIIPGEGVVIPFEDVGLRHVVMTNKALVSQDLGIDPRIVGREDRVIARAGFHGLLSTPLRLHGRPIGVLNFVSRTPGFYREEDIPIGQQIADQIAGFVGNLHVQQRTRTLIRHEAAEQERARVARDLYHAVAQAVPPIERAAEELLQEVGEAGQRPNELAQRVRELVREELAEVRRAVADMVPRGLGSENLEKAIQSDLASIGSNGAPASKLSANGDTSSLAGPVQRGAYRIFQEALSNVREHAQAHNVTVTLECRRDLVLTIEDDGRGFDADEVEEQRGLGLRFMRERAQALGALLSVDSAPGEGTAVRLELLGVRDAAEHPQVSPKVAGPAIANLRVFVAEKQHLLRAGLIRLLERAPDMRVIGEGTTAEEIRGQITRLRPDVVLLDARLVDNDLKALVKEIRIALPACALLVLSEFNTSREAELAQAGASGFLHSMIDSDELTEAVRAVAAGATVRPGSTPSVEGGPTLTERERSVLALVAAGQTNAEIGKCLYLATKTVERQVAQIVRKLGVRNRAHAAAVAVAGRIIEPPE